MAHDCIAIYGENREGDERTFCCVVFIAECAEEVDALTKSMVYVQQDKESITCLKLRRELVLPRKSLVECVVPVAVLKRKSLVARAKM